MIDSKLTLAVGVAAPPFELPDQNGALVALSDFRDKQNVVIYFYPRAFTPGCTKQACGLRDARQRLVASDTVALGISTDPVGRLKKFQQKHGLDFALLSDAEHMVAEMYGVWGKRTFLGKAFMGVSRSTFIIDKEGIVRHIIPKANPASHDDDVLKFIETNLKG